MKRGELQKVNEVMSEVEGFEQLAHWQLDLARRVKEGLTELTGIADTGRPLPRKKGASSKKRRRRKS